MAGVPQVAQTACVCGTEQVGQRREYSNRQSRKQNNRWKSLAWESDRCGMPARKVAPLQLSNPEVKGMNCKCKSISFVTDKQQMRKTNQQANT